jgi:hypothetical protein
LTNSLLNSLLAGNWTRGDRFARRLPGSKLKTQRLGQERQDIHQAITIYSDMYRNAVAFRSQWGTTQRDAEVAITQGIAETAMHTKSVYDRINCIQNYLNQGVPYNEALLLCQGR